MHHHGHAKTDSEVTSLAPSSPTRSPRRPVYYVQSPSRDSHDGEKTNPTSFHSTPVLSPAGSPPHSHSSVGRHSRESSSTRFSGSLKPGSRKVNPTGGSRSHRKGGGSNGGQKPWKECDVIEEEGLLEDQQSRKGLPRRCYFPAFVLGFFILFSFFALILYGAAKPQKPKITMRSITFETVGIQSGSDASGVSTDMMTLNSTVKFIYRNTASFFGVHVSSTPVDLSYEKITIASGDIVKFYQSRKTQRLMNINVVGNKVPLYGSGASLSSATGKLAAPVPLNLTFTVRSRAYVLGKLVKPKFYRTVNCGITLDPAKLNTAISLKNCTYN